jgi:CrcB protein
MMGMVLAVGVGGGLGALARYYIAGWIQAASSSFPWGIFIVNITGGLLMGMIVEAGALKLNLSPELRSFLTVGILGGYTTFSTFSLDSVLLLQKGEYLQAAFYAIGSVVLSILALVAGLWIMRTVYA